MERQWEIVARELEKLQIHYDTILNKNPGLLRITGGVPVKLIVFCIAEGREGMLVVGPDVQVKPQLSEKSKISVCK